MAQALKQHTAALPEVDVPTELARIAAKPRKDLASEIAEGDATVGPIPFGKRTSEAIALGVAAAVRGMAHDLIDRYAQYYHAYPRVIATGGDAALLFEHDDLVEIVVPDLALVGMLAAVQMLRDTEDDELENDG
jgi:pantothenate kinase type III